MNYTFRIIGLSLSLLASCACAAAPQTSGTTGATGSAGSAASAGRAMSAGRTTGGNRGQSPLSGSGLLCAGLLGSGILGDVFTVAPITVTSKTDPTKAIQFGTIWSDMHEASVEAPAPDKPRQSKPAVATVKLPISFSEGDQQKFAAAGWKRQESAGGREIAYCLEGEGGRDAPASSSAQGMVCVIAAR